jgi:hypothetical protein
MAGPGGFPVPQLAHTVALMLAPVACVKIGAAVVSLKVLSNSTVVSARAVPANGDSNTATTDTSASISCQVSPLRQTTAAATSMACTKFPRQSFVDCLFLDKLTLARL